MSKLVIWTAAFWTAIFGILAALSAIDVAGSFGWGIGSTLWLLIGMTAFGCCFVWIGSRARSRSYDDRN